MSLIKKNQLKYANNENSSVLKSSSPKFKLNLSIPKEKIEEEITLLKNELMKEAEEYRNKLEKEKELLWQKEQELIDKTKALEEEKESLFSNFSVTKEKLKKQAYDEGYKEGLDKGYSDGAKKGEAEGRKDHDHAKKDYEKALYDLMNKFKELDEYKKDILENTEPFLLNLLDAIIKKILSKSIEVDKNIMLSVVREALIPITSGHGLTIKVNPKNVEHLEMNKSKLLSEFMSVKECSVVGDKELSEGGCLIEADFGVIDSRIEAKMQSIKDLICSIKDCDEKEIIKETNPESSQRLKDKNDADDLFGQNEDELDFSNSLDDDSFDFLSDDD